MRLIAPQVKTIEQPVELFTVQCEGWGINAGWPLEALLLQAFVPQHKAILLPQQDFDLVTTAIDKHVQCDIEGVQPQGLFHKQRQTGD